MLFLEVGICKETLVRPFNWPNVMSFNRYSIEIMTQGGPGREYELGVVDLKKKLEPGSMGIDAIPKNRFHLAVVKPA